MRDKLPHDQIVHATFEDICNNPLAVVEKVFAKAGRKLTPEAIASCSEYNERRPAHHWGAYEYTLQEFGLNEAEINERFKDYRALFC